VFTKNAALELGGDGIRVNAILPGLIATPLTAPFMGNDALRDDFIGRIPLARPGTPEDIAYRACTSRATMPRM
jgi:NAD(P)-dependent dehydrogenase (short-subunit alcohol dehydrogenase family)